MAARVAGRPALTVSATSAADAAAAPTASDATTTAAAATPAAFLQKLNEALPDERLELMRDFVRERVMRVLKLPADAPPGLRDRLMEIGFDSLMAVQLRNQLGKGLGLAQPLPATVMFDQPTIEDLAQHLLRRVQPAPASAQAASSASPAAPAPGAATPLGAAAVAELSDEEVAALLERRLGA
jgi:hypothetical protein